MKENWFNGLGERISSMISCCGKIVQEKVKLSHLDFCGENILWKTEGLCKKAY
jgi:hypothetical protein